MAEQAKVPFEAFANIAITNADVIMKELCEHLVEHGNVTVTGRVGKLESEFGTAIVEAQDDCLRLHATCPDETLLGYMKFGLAEHVIEYAGGQKIDIVWQGDEASGKPLAYFREMQVVSTRRITPLMSRVVLRGDDLHRFTYFGVHVRLLIPPAGVVRRAWPVMGPDGRPLWPDAEHRPASRVYTIRNIDADRGEMEVDFVLHEGPDMPGARFGVEAKPGDYVGVMGPIGGDIPKSDWYLFAGDETALPAIARLLQELPASARAVVRIEVDGPFEEQTIISAANLDLQWLHRNGAPAGSTQLLVDAVRAVELPEDHTKGYVWVGCEFASFKAIRPYIRKERKMPRDRHLVMTYWRRGFAGDDAHADEH